MKFRWLQKNKAAVIAIVVTLLFAVANSILLLKDFYYLSLIPLAGLVLLLFVVRFETGLLCMALLTPFAIDMALMPKMELSMPVEPMMILFTLLFFFRVLASRSYDLRLLRHPVSIALLASLAWMFITGCTSTLPLVSFKYLLARLWFVVPFFFAAAQIFRDRRRIRQFFWCYAIGLIAVVCIATAKTVGNFSDLQTLHRVMCPFYNDHTAYGCVIALFLPAAFYFIFSRGSRGWARLLFFGIFALKGATGGRIHSGDATLGAKVVTGFDYLPVFSSGLWEGVLRYNWNPHLTAGGDADLEPVEVAPGVTFIRVRFTGNDAAVIRYGRDGK